MPTVMTTISYTQKATYFFAVCLFSISFLVFLNASVSFVVTDLINDRRHVGNDVGTLGFADELVALIACPAWGVVSDRVGVRPVATLGYLIVGLSLFLFVQASNVFPQLLLARLLFSLGGSATATMVTAILPAMTASPSATCVAGAKVGDCDSLLGASPSPSSNTTVTPERITILGDSPKTTSHPHSPTNLAGFVGLFTGLGALVALGLFLPLFARLRNPDAKPGASIVYTYYIVGAISLLVAIACFLGLRDLKGEENKGLKRLLNLQISDEEPQIPDTRHPYWTSLLCSIRLGVVHSSIGLGYLGGFVARASSVGISLFIPLYVNAYFISSGNCKDPVDDPSDLKATCPEAYVLAAKLTGISQLVALILAPAFGYFASRDQESPMVLLVATLAGMVGYVGLVTIKSPLPSGDEGNPIIFVFVVLIGVSQIGCIVCSLGLLGKGILGIENQDPREVDAIAGRASSGNTIDDYSHLPGRSPIDDVSDPLFQTIAPQQISISATQEATSLLRGSSDKTRSLSHLKGSIAGVYSFGGGAGILLLTKLGGYLFDVRSRGAPFYMLAIFNVLLFLATILIASLRTRSRL